MGKLVAVMVVALVAYPLLAGAQSAPRVKYCNDLAASYRKARADGKEPQPGAGEAIANCPTNPDSGIPALEKALETMKVDLPPK